MKKLKLTTERDLIVPCLTNMPRRPRAVTIITHGFASSKESPTAQLMLNKLPAAGIGAIAYDLPGHGDEEAFGTDLTIENCFSFLHTAEDWAAEEYPDAPIYYFSSSFGAYINLLYLNRMPFLGEKSFGRSAAVNMPELFVGLPDEAAQKEIDDHGYCVFSEGFPHSVRVPAAFFEDLKEHDLYKIFDPAVMEDIEILLLHGERDEVIRLERARAFAEAKGVPMEIFPGEDHSLFVSPDTPEKMAARALRFFG